MRLFATTSSMALAVALALPGAASAQTRAAGDGSTLETIVVTAQKREEDVQNAALSVTALSGATIQKDRVLTLEDLGHQVTGLSFTANSPQANEINIRGVMNTRLTAPTADQSVSTFVDDVYVSRSGNLNSAFYDVERIEVVRGPQGVLLGKNVAGGAINIISQSAKLDPSGKATITLGNYDLRQFSGYMTGQVARDLAARVSLQTINHSGYAKDILHNTDVENLDSVQGRIQLAYLPEDSDFRATFIADYSKDSNDGVNRVGVLSSTLSGPDIWAAARELIRAKRGHLSVRESLPVWPLFKGDVAPTPQRAQHETLSLIMKIEKDVLPNVRFTSITGVRDNQSFTLYDQTGLGPTNGYGVVTPLLFAEPVNFIESAKMISQEVRLTSTNLDSRFDWIVGAYYLRSRVHQFNRFWGESTVLPTLSGESHWDDTGLNEDKAVFAQVGFKITEQLKLEAGARYTHDHKSGFQAGIAVATGDKLNPNDTAPLTPLAVVPGFATNYGAKWSEVTPQATLRWTPNEDMMGYATVSKGFKGGGFQNDAPNAFAATVPYEPETVTNYEGGYKVEFLNHTVRWNTAVFYMKYKNLQVQQTLASCLCNVISNAPGATIKGIESDLQYAPTTWFHAWLTGNYLNARYDNFVFNGVDNSGHLMQRTPKWQTSVGAEVSTNVGSWEKALTGRLSYRYQAKMPWSPENTSWEEGYGTLDGRVTLSPPGRNWTLSVYGKNLTDELYRTNIIVFFHDEMSSYAAPRTFGVELSAAF